MGNFLLYLIESGMCLTLLYLVYAVFLRKETYFTFNRIYLIIILIASLVIPLIHVTIAVSSKDDIEETFQDIGKFRSYYTEFIGYADSEFGSPRYRKYEAATFEENNFHPQKNGDYLEKSMSENGINQTELNDSHAAIFDFNILKALLVVYLTGVLFFFIRLVILLFWLAKTVSQNARHDQKEYKLVLLEKEIPPFSFFKYVFVNKDAMRLKEFEQVLAHEKVHVGQLHSLDLILAHAVTVFQWFNPLVWNLQKALKTTHEYIADSKVVKQGFELFDYQSLLLSQLVSIQSVELVNNFNLISIKKRIAMMTKNKSRFSAKLKALFVIPMAIITFFLFAHMTVKSPILTFSNYSQAKFSNLDGIWENKDDSFGKLLLFEGNSLSILESANKVDVIYLDINIKDNKFQINRFGSNTEWVKYEFSGAELKIWWSENDYSLYHKTTYKNSYDAFKPKVANSITLPVVEYAKVLEKMSLIIDIYVFADGYRVDDVDCGLDNLKDVVSKRFYSFNKLEMPFVTARLIVDKNTEMKPVSDLNRVLREVSLLRVAYGSFPTNGASALQYHSTGLAQLLPPTEANGAVNLDRDDIKERIIVIEPSGDIEQKAVALEAFIRKHPDYIATYDWKNTTKYGEYIVVIDMVFKVIYGLRDEYAQSSYKLNYNELPDPIQKEIRKVYPMRLSQVNTDEE